MNKMKLEKFIKILYIILIIMKVLKANIGYFKIKK